MKYDEGYTWNCPSEVCTPVPPSLPKKSANNMTQGVIITLSVIGAVLLFVTVVLGVRRLRRNLGSDNKSDGGELGPNTTKVTRYRPLLQNETA
jgi:hypothetical protein